MANYFKQKKGLPRAKSRGFTLIELIISVGVIAIAIVGLYVVFVYGTKMNIQAKNLALGYQIANKELEEVRNTPYSELTDQNQGSFISDSSEELSHLHNAEGYLTITNYQNDPRIKEIIVEVRWNEDRKTKSVVLTTLATQGGINQ